MIIKNGRYTVEVTHGDKILFGKSGITKNELIQYYQTIAPIMIPYCDDRPISMQRFPEGIDKEGQLLCLLGYCNTQANRGVGTLCGH